MSKKSGVYKHTIVVEVLAEYPCLEAWTLADISYEMCEGGFMGVCETAEIRELTREEVLDEALRMGGDGTFFASMDEEEDYDYA